MKKRVALCQLNPIWGKPEANFKKIEQIIENYLSKKIVLFIFPEDFLFGILRESSDILNAGKEFKLWIKKFSTLAKKYRVDLIPGSLPCLKNGKLFNTTVYINKNSQILNEYSKTNLWHTERGEYSIDPHPPKCFNSVLGKTVQIICWDLMDHKLFEQVIKQGVEWIINVSFWYTNQTRDLVKRRGKTRIRYNRNYERLNSIIEARSTEYNVGMIFCNIGGIHKYVALDNMTDKAKSAGCSQIIAPLDIIRKIVKNRKEQILICDVPEIKESISDHEIFLDDMKILRVIIQMYRNNLWDEGLDDLEDLFEDFAGSGH